MAYLVFFIVLGTFYAAVLFITYDVFKIIRDRFDYLPLIVEVCMFAIIFILCQTLVAKVIRLVYQLNGQL
jgi:hypothetical protein